MPGETFGGDAHVPATREMVWVESGALTLSVAGERYELASGQCARFPAGRPHRYANEGADPVQLTMVVVVPPTEA
jgi:mannose-6-phosphate isomerase-like protein (cupin superfamily)